MLKYFIVGFFVVNAIFWSLFHHSIHCNVFNYFMPNKTCPPHSFYITIGIIAFIIAVIIAQYYFFTNRI
jgi:DMSO/TMAO reductase YedYZ heme-binding membrane subunit